jgi:O-antigen/teichoic acid export membrane protein
MSMTAPSIASKVLRNAKFNLFGCIWRIIVGLLLTPYTVNRLGVEIFGVWAMLTVITGFFSLLNCGAGTSFVKFIAEYNARSDHARINQLVNTGIVLNIVLSIFILIFSTVFIRQVVVFLNIPHSSTNHYLEHALYWTIATYCLSNIFFPIFSIQPGLQRLDISNKVSVLLSLPSAFGTVYFLEKGYGILGLVYNNLILNILAIVINCFIARALFPQLKLHPSLVDLHIGKKIWRFGYKLQLSIISAQVSQQIDKLILSHFLSIGMVTFYQLGSTVIENLNSLVLLIIAPVMPAFAEIEAEGDQETFLRGYTLGTKYVAMVVIPVFTFVILTAPQIMAVWMGNGYRESAFVIVILGLGYLVAVLSCLRSMALQATARTHIDMWAGILAMVLNIPLSLTFVKLYGFNGVAIGTAISLFVAVCYGLAAFHRAIGLPVWSFLREAIGNTCAFTVPMALLLLLFTNLLESLLHAEGREANLAVLTLQAVFFGGLNLIMLLYAKPIVYAEIANFLEDRSLLAKIIVRYFSKDPIPETH